MTEYSESLINEQQPTTVRPVVEPNNPYASTRGSLASKQLPTFDEAIINKYNRSDHAILPTRPL